MSTLVVYETRLYSWLGKLREKKNLNMTGELAFKDKKKKERKGINLVDGERKAI